MTQNGIFEKANHAKEESIKSQICEEIQLEIMGIMTSYTTQNSEITNQIIQDELEKNLEGIEISGDLTGTYKDYEYEIDNEYNVHIIGKTTDAIKLKVSPKIGTTYITINAQASSTKGEMVQYQYIIDGTTYSETQAKYTIENLEPESKHTIKVIVIDDKQNKKESREFIVKTEPRTYLYKYGNEQVQLTGGWREVYKQCGDIPVSNNFKMEKLDDNLKITSTGGIPRGTAVLMGASANITKRMDLSDYKYMCTVATISLGKYSAASVCTMKLDSDDEFLTPDWEENSIICLTAPVNKQMTKWDISKYNGMYSPGVYIQSEIGCTSEAHIYEVWLEK